MKIKKILKGFGIALGCVLSLFIFKKIVYVTIIVIGLSFSSYNVSRWYNETCPENFPGTVWSTSDESIQIFAGEPEIVFNPKLTETPMYSLFYHETSMQGMATVQGVEYEFYILHDHDTYMTFYNKEIVKLENATVTVDDYGEAKKANTLFTVYVDKHSKTEFVAVVCGGSLFPEETKLKFYRAD